MLIGNNKFGERIHIDDTIEKHLYYCPHCKMELITKKGSIKSHHFAHKPNKLEPHLECYLRSNSRVSIWYINWLNRFDKNSIEILLNKNNNKEIADVIIDNVIIQFSQLNITLAEFKYKNRLFTSLEYKVIWVFDLSKEYENGKLDQNPFGNNNQKYYWKHPKKLFKTLDLKNNNVQIYFQFSNTLKRIHSSEMEFKLFYTDKKKTYTIEDFINIAKTKTYEFFNLYKPISEKRENNLAGKTILELWSSSTRWMIVENIKNNNVYKLYYDPRNDIKMYNTVYGNLSSNEYYSSSNNRRFNFYENKVKLYDWNDPCWVTIVETTNKTTNKPIDSHSNSKNIKSNLNENKMLDKGKTIQQLIEENKTKSNLLIECLIDNTKYNLDFIIDTIDSNVKAIPYHLNIHSKHRKEADTNSSYYKYLNDTVWKLI